MRSQYLDDSQDGKYQERLYFLKTHRTVKSKASSKEIAHHKHKHGERRSFTRRRRWWAASGERTCAAEVRIAKYEKKVKKWSK